MFFYIHCPINASQEWTIHNIYDQISCSPIKTFMLAQVTMTKLLT